jgi:hypothetical protein
VIPFERHPKQPGQPGRSGGREEGRFGAPSVREIERSLGLAPPTEAPSVTRRRRARGAWLIGPAILAAIGAGMRIVVHGPDWIFAVSLGLLLGIGLLWILVSVLFPAKAERTCPACSGKGLERLDPQSLHGVQCRLCGWSDPAASSFLLAEEEGTFEDIVLHERGYRRGPPS